MNAPLRHIAGPIADESDLVNALRARLEELNVSRAELDAELDLPGGYSSKRLTLPQMKYYGAEAFWNTAEALGLAVILVEDPNARARYAARMKRRSAPQAITGTAHWRAARMRAAIPWLITKETARELGKKGGQNSLSKRSLGYRKMIAKMGVRARWKKRSNTSAESK